MTANWGQTSTKHASGRRRKVRCVSVPSWAGGRPFFGLAETLVQRALLALLLPDLLRSDVPLAAQALRKGLAGRIEFRPTAEATRVGTVCAGRS
jgi:hypothetical protein